MKLISVTVTLLTVVVVIAADADNPVRDTIQEAEPGKDVLPEREKWEQETDQTLLARLEAIEGRQQEVESMQRELEMQTLALESAKLGLKMLKLSTQKLLLDNRHDDISQQIAFSVALSYAYENEFTNIDYNEIYYNIGGAWNTDVHAFVAPVSGVYAFYTSCFAEGGENAKCRITRNNSDLLSAYSTNIGDEACSNQVIVQIEQGDQIAVRLNEGVVLGTLDDKYPTFSGYFLFSTS